MRSKRTSTSRRKKRVLLQKLEDRVFFSASPIHEAVVPDLAPNDPAIEASATLPEASVGEEYIFVDGGVETIDALIGSLLDSTDTHQHIVLLDADRDGLEQIAQTLRGKSDLSAIHLLSHGGDGWLRLGTTEINSANVLHFAGELSEIGSSLGRESDILIYGCNLASSAQGVSLVNQLSSLTGADVAASSDLTGAAELDGDWELEVRAGGVEAQSVQASEWNGTLSGAADVIWVLGNNGTQIDFSSGTPVISDTPGSQIFEGFASWTDPGTGELVLYTNGETVWNGQTHNVLQNGSGLSGDSVDSQPAAIVPVPGERGQFYLFQMDHSSFGILEYSVVDMGLGPEGAVTLKNDRIAIYEEGLDVIPHANGEDYWVLSYEVDRFREHLTVVATRFDSTGERNNVETATALTWYTGGADRSFITHSSDNTKLLLGKVRDGDIATADFDPATGELSNSVLHVTGGSTGYAAAFSPDATKFYYSVGGTGTNGTPHQYDLLTDTITQLSTEAVHGGPGLGPDGKVYFARSNDTTLSVVNNPNVAGVGANFVFQGLDLTDGGANPTGLSGLNLFNQVAVQPSLATGPLLTLDTSSVSGGLSSVVGLSSTDTVQLATPTASITDPDSTEMVSFQVEISGVLDGDSEVLNMGGRSIPLGTNATYVSDVYGSTTFSMTYNAGTDILSISNNGGGGMPIGDAELLLRTASYDRTGPINGGQRDFRFVVNDGAINSTAPIHRVAIGFQHVNTEDAYVNVVKPRVTALNDGSYVVVWDSFRFGGSTSWEAVGQLFDPVGAKVGDNFVISELTDNTQRAVEVIALQDGGFATVFETLSSADDDTSSSGVAIRFFDASGVPRTDDVTVNTYITNQQREPTATQLVDGNIAVTWTSAGQDGDSNGVFGQLLDTNGNKIGSEFQVNSSTHFSQSLSAVSQLDNGGFVVVWQDQLNDTESDGTTSYGVFAQVFDAAANRIGAQIHVAETIDGNQRSPDVAASEDGFVAIWEGAGPGGTSEVFYRQFDALGQALGHEGRVNSGTFGTQDVSTVIRLADGGFFAVFDDFFDDGVQGRRFNANGFAITPDQTIDASTDSRFEVADISQLPSGNMVATYINADDEIFVREILNSLNPMTIDGLADLNEPLNRLRYSTFGVPIHVAAPTSSVTNFAPTAVPYRMDIGLLNGDTVNDVIAFENQGTGPGQVGLIGTDITYEGNVIGTVTNTVSGSTSVLRLDFTTTPSTPMLEALIHAVTFSSTDPGTGNDFGVREVRFEVIENGRVLTREAVEIAVTPLDQEFLVNTSMMATAQTKVDTIKLADGNYVVSWQDPVADGDLSSTMGRIYAPDGIPITEPIFLATHSRIEAQTSVRISALDNGNFVAAWQTETNDDADSDEAIAAQIFAANGDPIGDEIRVNTTTAGAQIEPDVVGLAGGQFMIAWLGDNGLDVDGVAGQVFDANGQKVGAELQINTTTLGIQQHVRLEKLSDGNVVVVWSSGDNVAFRRYDASGNALDASEQIGTAAAGIQSQPSVVGYNGGFAIAWQGEGAEDADGIYFQRFHNSGAFAGATTIVNETTAGAQEFLELTATDQLIAIVWSGNGTTGATDDSGIWFRAFGNSGASVSAETLINPTTDSVQSQPSVVPGRTPDEFFFAWQSTHSEFDNGGNRDVFEEGIFARSATVVLNGVIDLDTDDSSGATDADFDTSYFEGMVPSKLADTDVSIVEVNGGGYVSLDLTVSGVVDTNNEFLHLGGQAFDLSTDVVAPQTVTVSTVDFDVTYDSTTNAFRVVRNGGGTMTTAELRSIVGDLAYSNSTLPTEGPRTISWTADESGVVTNPATTTMDVWQFNEAPVISADASTPYLQTDPAVVVDSSITITDSDDTQMAGAVVTLADVDRSTDQLTLTPAATTAATAAGITVTAYNPVNGQFRFSGAATIAEYETVLEGVAFSSFSPVAGDRAIDFVIEDLRNSSLPSTATIVYTVDTTPPATPTVVLDMIATDDSGLHDDDDITNVNTPSFVVPAGTGTPGDTVTILSGGLPLETTTVLADGSFGYTPAVAFADGNYDLSYTFTDLAGNVSGAAPLLPIEIDTVRPSNTNIIYNRETNDTTPRIAGFARTDPGEYLEVEVNGQFYNLGTNNGLWEFDIPPANALADGVYPIYSRIFDLAGNVDVDADTVTVDTVPPAVPTVDTLVTADRTPQLTGTVVLGADEDFRVRVDGRTYYDNWAQLSVVGNVWTLDITREIEPDGVYEVIATVEDIGGNTSTDTTVGELTVDLLEPAIPTVNALTTNDTTPAVTGTSILEPGESLEVTINGVTYLSSAGDISFSGTTWTVVVPTALAEGTYEVLAFATDGAGNDSTDTTTNELIIDTTPPAIPTVNSQTSADSTPIITGTAVVGADETLRVRVDGLTYSEFGSSLTRTGTDWSLQVPNVFEITPSGTYEVVATVTDDAGNVSTDVTTGEFVLDMLDPPTVNDLETNDTTPAISGTVSINQALGETLDVTVNSVTYNLGDGNLGITGSTWTLTIPTGNELSDGTYDVMATVSDIDGNAASDASLDELLIDTVPPAIPTVNSQVTADATPLITGTATIGANEDFRVQFNGRTYYDWQTALTVVGTDWSLQIPTGHELSTNGVYEVQATVEDAAGNESTDVTVTELVFDTQAPDMPIVDILAVNDDTPAITGTATLAPDETLAVEVNGQTYNLGDGNLGLTGSTWTLTIPTGSELADGTYEVIATATDSANNSTTDNTTNELTVDTVPPVVPTVNAQVSNDSTPFITGTAVIGAGEELTIRLNGIVYPDFGTHLTVAGTDWSLQVPTVWEFTANGVYEVIATVTDAAGNATTDVTTGEFTYDTVLPDAPVVDTLATNDSTPAITGTAALAPDETLAVEVNGVTYNLGDGSLGMSGSTWTLVIPVGNSLIDGVYEVVATATDSLGNSNTDATTDELTIDTVAPAVPTVDVLVSNDPTPLLTGTATVGANEELRVRVNDFTYYDWSAHLTVAGTNWSLQIPALFEFTANGVYEVEAYVTDSAGNETSDTTLGEFTYDTVLPDAPVVDFLATNDTTPAITGTTNLAADETLAVEVDGVTYSQGDGNLGLSGSTWTLVIPLVDELVEGTYEVVATATDSLGNTNSDATTNELVIDLTSPAVPTIDPQISNDPTPLLTGTATVLANESLTVRVNGFTYFETGPHLTLAGTDWSLQIPTIREFTANGVYEVEATVTDQAGNSTTDTTLGDFTYDTVLPDAPVVDFLATNDTTPAISGTANLLGDETLAVEVNGVTYTQGDGNLGLTGSAWTLVIPPGNTLAEGTYEVVATATDSIGNTNNDATTNELVIDLTPPATPTVVPLVSNDPTPLLTGTAIVAVDEDLRVIVNGITYHDAQSNLTVTGTNWSLQIPTIFEFTADGVYEVEATVTDLAGNATSDVTLGEFTYDTVLPDAPTVTPLATNDTTPAIRGTATLAADETLSVEVNGVTYNLGDGNLGMIGSDWTLVIPTGNELGEALHDVHATVTDSLGNANNDATSGELLVDLTPPAIPSVNALTSNDPTPILTGTATVQPGESFTVRVNGVTYFEGGPHLALAGTNWSLQVPTFGEFNSDGVYEVEATVTDSAGNVSTDTTIGEFTFDTVLPDAPTVTPLATNDSTPAISGTANLATDETLAVEVNGITYNLGDGNLGMAGSTWTLVVPTGSELVEGTYDVHATVTDSIGNVNNDATSAELVVDFTPPAVPTVDNLVSNDPTPLLTGTAIVGTDETLTVSVNGATYSDGGTSLTLAGTNWSLQIPTIFEFNANGVYEVEATVTDLAGNATTDTTLGEFTFDTVLPDAPTVVSLATNDTTPAINGTANLAGDETLSVEVNGVVYSVGDGNLGLSGSTWTLIVPPASSLPEGTYDVHATITDSIGNTNADATSGELVVDLTPPAIPTVNSLVTNDNTPFLTGTAIVAADETLTVRANGVTYSDGDTHLSLAGTNWSLQVPTIFEYTANGTYDIEATVSDLAGNVSADVTLGEYTLDTNVPSAPVVNPLTTNDTSPTISGVVNLAADETLAVEVNGVTYNSGDGNLVMNGSTWTLVIPPANALAEGTYDVHATVTDLPGNTNNDTTSGELVIDLTPPAAPTVDSLISNDPTPLLTGTATVSPTDTLSVRVNGITYADGGSHLTLAGSNWSLQVPTIFEFTADGVYEVEATVIDQAGNLATDATLGEFTYDTVLPDAPVVTPLATNDTTPAISGTANLLPDEVLSVLVDGVTYTLGDGNLGMTGSTWTLVIPTGNELIEATYDVHATVVDSIGNTNNDATSAELVVDLTPPATPTVNTLVSNDPTPILTGTAVVAPDETLTVRVNSVTYSDGDPHLTLAGTDWSLQVPTLFEFNANGVYEVEATVTDLAGNATTDTTLGEFTFDTVLPDAPVVNGLVTTDTTPTITGTASLLADEVLTVEVDGVLYSLGDGNLSMAGSTWTLVIPTGGELAEGTYDINARATDSLGNTNVDATSGELVIDLTPPSVPTVNALVSNDATPFLTGTAIVGPGESLSVEANGVTFFDGDTHLSLAGTNWSLQIPAGSAYGANGTYDILATITDAAGNTASDVTSGEYTLDTTVPSAPVVNPLTTNDTLPTITGVVNLAADESLDVEVNGVVYSLGDGNLNSVGSAWTLVIPLGNELAEGTYDVAATVTDSLGNTNDDTTSSELVVDVTPPATPTVDFLVSNDPTPILTGTANVSPGETLTVSVNGATYADGGPHLTLAGTNWSLQIPTAGEFTSDAVYDVEATVTDEAGNATSDSTLAEFTFDTVLPDAPTVNVLVTNGVTPTISGTANLAADEVLNVDVDGVLYTLNDGNLSIAGSDWTLVIPTGNDLLERIHEVHATVTDSIGNTNNDATTNEVLVDLTPPETPTVDSLASNDSTPFLTGTAIVGTDEILQVQANGRTYTNGDGHLTLAGTSWSLQVPTSDEFTVDGTYDVVATVTDLAGNVSTDITGGEFTYDTVPPEQPSVDVFITNEATPTISGIANVLADETLTVTVNGNTYTLGDGNLSLTGSTWTLVVPPSDALPEGTYDIFVTATDPVGNASQDVTTNELVVDLTPPVPPTVNSLATNDSTPLLSGTAIVPAGGRLAVAVNGLTYLDGDGHLTIAGPVWSLQIPTGSELPNPGVYDVTAAVLEPSGNVSLDESSAELNFDPTLPDAPTVQPQATNESTPTITGTATLAPGDTLSVEVDGQTYTGSDLTIVGSDWSLTVPAGQALLDGTYEVVATVTDTVGNINSDATSNELIVDLTPPVVPTANESLSNDLTPLLTGTATLAPGDSLEVIVDGNTYTVGDGNLSLSGSDWLLQIPESLALSADGPYDVQVSVTDLVGNTSVDPTSGEYVLDTTPPAQPTVNALVANDAAPLLSGTATLLPGETLTVEANGVMYFVGDGNLSLTGSDWSLQVPVANSFSVPGTYDISAIATDAIGNVNTDATTDEFTFSAGLPVPPTVDTLATNSLTPTLTGTALLEPDESLVVAVNGVSYVVGDGNLSLAGNAWSLQIPNSDAITSDGSYEVTATVSDSLGNVATDLSSNELTLDTTPPVAPTVSTLATNNNSPTITGSVSLAADETLSVFVNGVTYVPGDGNLVVAGSAWSLTIPAANVLPDGDVDVVATATDALGNTSSDSTTNELSVDTTPPVIPTVTSQSSNNSTPVITGTAVVGAGEVLSVIANGVNYVEGDGNLTLVGNNWMLHVPTANAFAAEGTYDITATVTDAVGNISTDSTSGEFVFNTSLPNIPTVDFQLTDDTTPTITGTATLAPDESLTVVVDGVTYVEGDGDLTLVGTNWTLTIPPTQTLSPGTVEVTAIISDGLGGTNTDTTSVELLVDVGPGGPALGEMTSQAFVFDSLNNFGDGDRLRFPGARVFPENTLGDDVGVNDRIRIDTLEQLAGPHVRLPALATTVFDPLQPAVNRLDKPFAEDQRVVFQSLTESRTRRIVDPGVNTHSPYLRGYTMEQGAYESLVQMQEFNNRPLDLSAEPLRTF